MKGDKFLASFLDYFWGSICRQPPPANPFSKPLIGELGALSQVPMRLPRMRLSGRPFKDQME